jgi:hypothetical protein
MFVVVILISLSLSSCGYEGDGQYQTSGIWPLRNYSLDLPDVEFASNSVGRFSLAGYQSHGRSLVQLVVSSPDPIAFHRLNASVELKLEDALGTTYFYRNGPLNRHYLRMVDDGETSYALETEWNCDFQYGDPDIDDRVVSFDAGKEPSPQRTLRCWHFAPTGNQDLLLTIRIDDVAEGLTDVVLKTKILSGWK